MNCSSSPKRKNLPERESFTTYRVVPAACCWLTFRSLRSFGGEERTAPGTPLLIPASVEGRGDCCPAAFRYCDTLIGATALGTLALGALRTRRAAAVATALGAAAPTLAAALAPDGDAQRGQRNAQTRRNALLEALQLGIQVSHRSPPYKRGVSSVMSFLTRPLQRATSMPERAVRLRCHTVRRRDRRARTKSHHCPTGFLCAVSGERQRRAVRGP